MILKMIIQTLTVIAREALHTVAISKIFFVANMRLPRSLCSLAMTAIEFFPLFLKAFYSITFFYLLCGCGFKSEPQLAASRLQYSKNKCPELYITDNYSTSTNNSITAKQVYKIEAKSPNDKNYNPANAYPVYHSFINNTNLVGNIMVNKNIRAKACQDYYLTNIKYFEK
jgi:hypothetical protein